MAKSWLDQAREMLTSLQTKGVNYVQQGIQNYAQNNYNQAGNILKAEPVFNAAKKAAMPVYNIEKATGKAVGNFIPQFAQSASRVSPPGQLVQSMIGLKNPNLYPAIRDRQRTDAYNMVKGYGLARGGVVAPVVAAGVGVGMNAVSNALNKKPLFENYAQAGGNSVVDMAPYGPISNMVGSAIGAASKIPLKPIQKAVTILQSLEKPLVKMNGMGGENVGISVLKRAVGSGMKGAAEGVINGSIRPLQNGETRQNAVMNDAASFALMGAAMKSGSDVLGLTKDKAAQIMKQIGIKLNEHKTWMKLHGWTDTGTGWTSQSGAIDLNAKVENPLKKDVTKGRLDDVKKFGTFNKIDINNPVEQQYISRFADKFETTKSPASGLTYSTLDKMGSLNSALRQKGFKGVDTSGDFKGIYSLDKVLNDPVLFEKYPQLKEVNVVFADFHTPTQKGVHINNDIFINSKLYAKDKTALESTIVHEIQHAKQKIKNNLPEFSHFEQGRGMTVKEYATDLREVDARRKQQQYLDSFIKPNLSQPPSYDVSKFKSADDFIKDFTNKTKNIEFGDDLPDIRRGITKEGIDLNRQFIETAQQPKYQKIYEQGGNDTDVLKEIYKDGFQPPTVPSTGEIRGTYYHGSDNPQWNPTTTKIRDTSAFGKGVYLSTDANDAVTWGKNVTPVKINGKIFTDGRATPDMVKVIDGALGGDRFSKKLANGDDVFGSEMRQALVSKLGSQDKANAILKQNGYSAYQHVSARGNFEGKAKNLVVFDPKDIFSGEIPKGVTGSIPQQSLQQKPQLQTAPLPMEGQKVLSSGTSIPPGGKSPEIDPVQKLIQALKEAKPIRGQQEALYVEARSKQAGALSGIQGQAGGESGFYKELGQLKGQLPKAEYESVRKNFTQNEVDMLFNKVKSANISPFEKVTAQSALVKMLGAEGGQVPTKGELDLLHEIFPPELTQALMEKRPFLQKLFTETMDALNIPRAAMATMDFSAPLRQGAFLIGRPKQWIPAFGNMFKYAFNPKAYEGLNQEIKARPSYPQMRESKLALTDMGSELSKREESFMSTILDKIPGIGAVTKASNRAYSGFLNKLRADTFDSIITGAKESGSYSPKVLQDTARFVNSATGRGDLGMFQKAAPILNATLFSPRLVASRLNLLNPVYYAKLDPVVRKEALKSLFSFAATGLTVATLAKMGGADVSADPRSADFGKIKIGNTRYDPYAGFQQYIRLAAQLISGQKVNSTTGVAMTLGEGYKPITRMDIIQQFFENKESPVASFVTGLLNGQNSIGQPFNIPDELKKRFIPLVIQDMQSLMEEKGAAGALWEIPGLFGVGSQTYGQKAIDVVRGRNGLDTEIRRLVKIGRTAEAKALIDKNKTLLMQGTQLAPIQKEINKQIGLKKQAQQDIRLTNEQRKRILAALDDKINKLNTVLEQEFKKMKGQ